MSRRIDKVELIHLPILRLIVERDALRLDGDSAFALQIHGVQNLGLHLTVRQTAAELDDTVRQRRLTVVNVRDNGEITYVLHY